jgi:hypothetical protein
MWDFVLAGLLLLAALYALFIEPRWLEVTRRAIPTGPPRGLRIAHLSDLHLGSKFSYALAQRAVELANSLQPDIAVVTGDLVAKGQNEDKCAKLLSGLRASRGVYVVFGAHDLWAGAGPLRDALSRAGVRVLDNEVADLGSGWWIVGVEDNSGRDVDLSAVMRELSRQRQGAILLAHSPDIMHQVSAMNHAGQRISLVLCGHTHGGQLRLPVIGPLVGMGRYARRYSCGLYKVGATWLYVTRGVGTYLVRMRFLCRPEVALLDLRPVGPGGPGQRAPAALRERREA